VPARIGEIALSLPFAIFNVLLDVLVTVFLAVYWLLGTPSFMRFARSLVDESRRARFEHVLDRMGQAMGGYVRGSAINAVVMGALAWGGLALIGVDSPLVLGVLTMLGEPIPIIGPILVAVPVIAAALLQSVSKALLALALYTLLQQFEGHLLTPNIMRRQTDVPQTLVIFALVAGGVIGGLLGVLASIPIAAALHVLAVEVLAPMVRRATRTARDADAG
jgi:predicted PurR-regulated permease PerM